MKKMKMSRSKNNMILLAQRAIEEDLSVRVLEEEVKRMNKPKKEEPKAEESDLPKIDYLKDLEQRMQAQLGRKVKIAGKGKKKTIQLTYEDNEDLEELLRLLCGEDFLNRV